VRIVPSESASTGTLAFAHCQRNRVRVTGIISQPGWGDLPFRSGVFPFPMGNYSLARFCNTSKRQGLGKESALMNLSLKKESEWNW